MKCRIFDPRASNWAFNTCAPFYLHLNRVSNNSPPRRLLRLLRLLRSMRCGSKLLVSALLVGSFQLFLLSSHTGGGDEGSTSPVVHHPFCKETWCGEATRRTWGSAPHPRIYFVISHCDSTDLSWLPTFVSSMNYEVAQVYIFPKCGLNVPLNTMPSLSSVAIVEQVRLSLSNIPKPLSYQVAKRNTRFNSSTTRSEGKVPVFTCSIKNQMFPRRYERDNSL